jgi:hypothetical protein
MNTVNGLNLPHGLTNSLDSDLAAAQAALAKNHTNAACGDLALFVQAVMAQSGKKITVNDANQLIAQANVIEAQLGCR